MFISVLTSNPRISYYYCKTKPLLIILVSALLAARDMTLRVGPASLRMATASSDDNFAILGMVSKAPEKFVTDLYAQIISQTQSVSLFSQFTRILDKAGVSSVQTTWQGTVFFQRFFLYISIAWLAWTIAHKVFKSILVIVIFSNVHPYYWNLGWFGALDDQPYTTWVALPFFIAAFAAFLSKKTKLSVALTAFAILIHPSMGICFAPILLFLILKKDRSNLRMALITLLGAALAIAIWSKMALPPQSSFPKYVEDIAYTNPHLVFYNPIRSIYKLLSIRAWLLVVVMHFFWFQYARKNKDQISYLAVRFSIALTLGYVILSEIFLVIRFTKGISIVPLRVTAITSAIGFVYLTIIAIEKLNSKNFMEKFPAFLVLIFPAPIVLLGYSIREIEIPFKKNRLIWLSNFLIFGSLAIPAINYLSGGNSNALYRQFLASKISETIFNPQNQGFISYLVPSLYLHSYMRLFLILTVCYLLFIALVSSNLTLNLSKKKFRTDLLTAIVMIFVIIVGQQSGMKDQYQWSFGGKSLKEVSDYRDAQLWAKRNTSQSSVFFIDGSFPPYYVWRTLSERAVANPNPIWSLYNYPTYVDAFNAKRNAYWENAIKIGQVKFAGDWGVGYFCSSNALYSIDYVVRVKSQKDLPFPVVYANDSFKIEKVVC